MGTTGIMSRQTAYEMDSLYGTEGRTASCRDRRRRGNGYRERAARARARRARKVKIQLSMIAAFLVMLILMLCILRFGFSAQADENVAETGKLYTSVLITYEMSAEDYAAKYADPDYYRSEKAYLQEVCRINHLTMKNGKIQGAMPGNYLIIPYYAEITTEGAE